MKPILTTTLQLASLLCLTFCTAEIAIAQSSLVGVYAQHSGGKIVYNYTVINSTPYEISSVWVGYNTFNDNNIYNNAVELRSDPSGMVDPSIPPASVTSPLGWEAIGIGQEETLESSIDWRVIDGSSPRLTLVSGQTLTGMSIKLDQMDSSYLTSHASLHFSNYPAVDDLTVQMESLDVVAPTLKVTLAPLTLTTKQRGKLVPITATITVSDNYDPAPDIQLVSITANEVLSAGDVQGATLGTNDRSFSLMAAHKTKTTAARVYTVTYSATDASGNKSLATATVSAL